MGRGRDSKEQVEIGKRYVLNRFGDDTYYVATAERYSGWLDLKEGNIAQARKRNERAYQILTGLYKMHRTISATTYMLGSLELIDGTLRTRCSRDSEREIYLAG
ncbi:uncharacterized protein RCO7_11634 [Rhynchosporium graminicola]|uniref:Uncharacterized protein n=1 Tax=Rhynchosporium graminicola TaxID=2792576 RepID=A0A1E1LJJ2_9HELO|nr:uncharacterized protein RCO7_11634 [Rhynchosporium commune]